MNALVKSAPGAGHLALLDVPQPRPGPGAALVRVRRSGLCGTDLLVSDGVYKGRNRPVPCPLILGHEAAGEIVALGENGDSPLFPPGDRGKGDCPRFRETRVVIEALAGCGACFHCVRGRYNLCPDWHHVGLTMDGALADFVVVPVTSLIPLPDGMSLDAAALLEPLATAINTVERTRPAPGTPTAILGPGPFGLLHLLALRAAGAGPIVVFGRPGDEARLAIAAQAGADAALVADRTAANAFMSELTHGVGAGLVVEAAGTPEAVQTAIDIAAAGGTLATLGLVRDTQIDALQVMRKELTWVGVVASVRRHWAEAIRLVTEGRLHPERLITHRMPLAGALDGFAALRAREAVKVMFEVC